MTARYLYIKFTGFLLVIVGLTYSITSLFNLFSYLFGNVSVYGSNTFVMTLGIIMPLFMFIFGIFFFMYTDSNVTKINKKIFICSIIMMVFGLIILLFKNTFLLNHVFAVAQITYFLHISLGIMFLVLGLMVMYACIKYKL